MLWFTLYSVWIHPLGSDELELDASRISLGCCGLEKNNVW